MGLIHRNGANFGPARGAKRAPLRVILAGSATLLAMTPWLGRYSGNADALASFLPLAIPLGLAALLLPPWQRPGSLRIVLALLALGVSSTMFWREIRGDTAMGGTPETGQSLTLTIVTHNLWVANADPEETIASLLASRADVLVLEEANGRMGPYLSRLEQVYPFGNHCPTGCDVVIRSKWPLATRVRWRLRDGHGQPYGPGLMQTRVLLPDGQSFPLLGIHLPHPTPPGPQRDRIAALGAALATMDRQRMILAGDFNLTPWARAMNFMEQSVAPLRRVTRASFSFPARIDGFVWPAPLLPIDHVWAGPGWETLSTERLPATGSDHYPLRVRLRLRRN